jgi:hypothetical protein
MSVLGLIAALAARQHGVVVKRPGHVARVVAGVLGAHSDLVGI